ncbi:MAG: hypothetical protein ACI9UQ_001946 [Candidatus Krumholzibacteriia bacterium]|jgi:hypothetical protein
MKKILWAIVAALFIIGMGVSRLSRDEVVPESAPRVLRMISPAQLLNRIDHLDELWRLRSAFDVITGEYSAAMAPVMVDWEASEPDAADGFLVIHNVNSGGNPVDGTTVLGSARLPFAGLVSAEFTLLPLDTVKKEGLIQHGQLRFVFSDELPVELLNFGGREMGGDNGLSDIVISWEAWRAPDAGYDVMTGMNPDAYLLTPRVFSGPTRFLDDALSHRDWYSYPLRMPNGQAGLVELLKTSLTLCDGVARHTVVDLLQQGELEWLQQAPGAADTNVAGWDELREVIAQAPAPADSMLSLPANEMAYQSVLRSCATLALYSVNVAVARLMAAGHRDGIIDEHLMAPGLGGQESWMSELATTDLKGVFVRAPTALKYLRANPQILPSNIPGQLERAGLLQMQDGGPVKLHYSLYGTTPYGTLSENLIR